MGMVICRCFMDVGLGLGVWPRVWQCVVVLLL